MKQILFIVLVCAIIGLPTDVHAGDSEKHDEHEHKHEGHRESNGHHDDHEADKINLSASILQEKGISFSTAGPGNIRRAIRVNGRISANQNRLAHIHPRFSGMVKEVYKELGENIEKGEVLALIESNQSLQRYEVVSLLSGTVIFRHATVGEFVTEADPIFVVADLSNLWVDLFIFPSNFNSVELGQRVQIRSPYSDKPVESSISFVSQLVDERTQARIARTVIENNNVNLYPDQYVDADILVNGTAVSLVVSSSALLHIGDKTILFARDGEDLEPREITPGRSDGENTEIVSGLEVGTEYAFGNTYFLKAELGKGSAEHDH